MERCKCFVKSGCGSGLILEMASTMLSRDGQVDVEAKNDLSEIGSDARFLSMEVAQAMAVAMLVHLRHDLSANFMRLNRRLVLEVNKLEQVIPLHGN